MPLNMEEMNEMMSEGKREMPLTIPFYPLLKGEETVMMIIRLGNIFPPLTFPSDFPDFPNQKGICICVWVRAWLCSCVLLMQF